MAQVRIRKRGKTFSYIFEAGKIDGKRKVVEKGGFPTKAEAYKAGVAAYTDFLHGNIGITSESITLRDFMTSWLNNVVALNVKPSTLITYKTLLPRQIIPYLGEVKRHIITPERFKALLKKYPFGTDYHIPLLLLYHTGMRIGEVLGLSWSDINFMSKRVNLSRQIRYLSKQGYYSTTLKTESSKRYIIVGDYLLGELKRWKNQQAENEVEFGDSYVQIYREADGHIQCCSKSLPVPESAKYFVSLHTLII